MSKWVDDGSFFLMWMLKQFFFVCGVGGVVEFSVVYYLELKCDLVQIQFWLVIVYFFVCIRCDGFRCFDDLEFEIEFWMWIDGLLGNIED